MVSNNENLYFSHSCCNENKVYGIPCKHFLKQRQIEGKEPLLTICDFSVRWIHPIQYQNHISVKSTISNQIAEEDDDELDFSYPSLVGEFDPYFSVAAKSKPVQGILLNSLKLLKDLEVRNEDGLDLLPPNNLKISGAPKVHPRFNVDHTNKSPKSKKNDLLHSPGASQKKS